MKPKMFVFIGGPGVGKGTFAKLLLSEKAFQYVEVGTLLRSLPKASKVHKIISEGKLVPEKEVFKLIDKRISKFDVILDGFPRTISQAQWLIEKYVKKFQIHVIYLYAPDELLITRITKRVTEGSTRTDDKNKTTVNHRLNIFQTETIPAVNWLKQQKNIKFSKINAIGEVSNNFKQIKKAMTK